jgi:metallophosphoesterase (TIGR00282 family)
MKILCIGDIVGRTGRYTLEKYLPELRKDVDFVIANAENSAHGRGMNKKIYEELSDMGIDAFTMGNHTWGTKDIVPLLEYQDNIIRPANLDPSCPGKGSLLLPVGDTKIGIINLIGRTYMDPCDSPFRQADKEIEKLSKETNLIFVDFHAEATSEKIAMGWYLAGRVTAVFGTHTHVQTADETILKGGTGYITDLGMTGPIYSVLGMERKIVIDRFLNGMPQRFELADGKGRVSGALFEVDASTGKTAHIERILIEES